MNDGISTLANDTSTVVNEHLSEWTASDWIGEIAALAVGGVVGAVELGETVCGREIPAQTLYVSARSGLVFPQAR